MSVASQGKSLQDNTNVRRAILILGMHRSGTSAVTRCLNLLGAELGSCLMPAAENNNPKGFWEHAEAVRIHEELLAALDRTWGDARALPDKWLSTSAAGKAREALNRLVRREFGGCALSAIKDPRLSRLVPLWREVLAEQGIEASAVLSVRHPFEVAESLRIRDGMPVETAYLGWLEHFAEAEIDTRSMPRSLVLYEDLLLDARRVIGRIAKDLRIEWPRSFDEAQPLIDGFLDKDERHQDAAKSADRMPDFPKRLYGLCQAHAAGSGGWSSISHLVDEYRSIAPTFLGREELLIEELRESERRARWAEHAIDIAVERFDQSAAEARAIKKATRAIEDHAVLYYRSEPEGFSEQHLQICSHAWDESKVTFRFELPAGKLVVGLRFDPSHHSGAFCVDGLKIGGVPLQDLAARVRQVNQFSLGPQMKGNGIWFGSLDDDPYVEFDLEGCAIPSNIPIDIEVDCRRFDVGHMIAPFTISELGELRREIELQRGALVGELSRQSATIETLRSRSTHLQAELLAATESEARLQQEAIAQHAEIERLEADVMTARERERASRQDCVRLVGDLKELRDMHAGSQIAAAAVAAELAAIKASTLWRAFLRMRTALLRVPPGARPALRRIAKGTWWIITPWRMPARLRFLAQRREGRRGASVEAGQMLAPEAPAYVYVPPVADTNKISKALAGLRQQTRFSVVVPVYNTDPALLKRMITSVESQWYPNWELILVDDHSPAPHVQQILGSLDDARIVVIRLDENKRISGATNEGIARARGDFLVFLDHDDELASDCLYELALCIDRENPDFVYSDEDKLDVDGSFRDPFFKPDWSPDTMMSTMYTCHVSCVRRSLALEIGGLRSDYDGSQDWDFVLRLTERTTRISHIPKVLYHWRIIPDSCASDLQVKPYAIDASKRAREDALRRRGLAGDLVPVPELPGYFRTRYHLKGEPLFSIIIPSKNNGAVLKTCIDSIFEKTAYRRFEVVVIDNGSTESSTLRYLKKLRSLEQVAVLDHPVPFNYSEINNFAVRHANGEIFVFLNDDTEVLSGDWLDYMGGYAQLAHVGAVGAKLLYPGEQQAVQHGGVINLQCGPSHAFLHMHASEPGYFNRNLLEYDWLAITGACMMLERKKFEAVGGFDEELAVAYNDTDLCFSLYEAGLLQVVCPSVTLIHHESLTRGDDTANAERMARLGRERTVLFQKHPDLVGWDPFHNPNLDPDDVHFGIRLGSRAFESCASANYKIPEFQTNHQCGLDAVGGERAAGVIQVSRLSPVTIVGWMGDGRGNAAGDFVTVLEDGLHSYYALARTRVPRPDVAKALRCDGLANSGFRMTVSLADVLPGTYKLLAVKPDDPAAACTLAPQIIVQ